jgi:hypothetical protein
VLTEREQLRDEILAGVSELLSQHESRSPELVDPPTLARILGVSPAHVYRHQRELGAIKVGAAVRFDVQDALERVRVGEKSAPAATRRAQHVEELLPIR